MAESGNPADIAALSVGITGDPTPLYDKLDKAVEDAKTKGEKIGEAVAEGVAQGMEKGDPTRSGGTVGPQYWQKHGGAVGPASSYASNDEWMKAVMADERSRMGAGAQGGGGLDAIATAGLSGQLGQAAQLATGGVLVAAIDQLVAQLLRIEKIGETIGDGLFKTTKQQAELDDAINRLNDSIARQNAIDERRFNRTAGGNIDIDPDVLERTKKLEEKATAAEQTFITHQAKSNKSLGDWFEWGVEKFSLAGIAGLYESSLSQEERQAKELRAEANRQRAQLSGIMGTEKDRHTVGGVVGSVADELGIPRGMLGTGGALSPAAATILAEQLRINAEMTRRLVDHLSRSNRQQQQWIVDQTTGGTVQVR